VNGPVSVSQIFLDHHGVAAIIQNYLSPNKSNNNANNFFHDNEHREQYCELLFGVFRIIFQVALKVPDSVGQWNEKNTVAACLQVTFV
jgi:hypothetical protein